jgi:hypothetical protein
MKYSVGKKQKEAEKLRDQTEVGGKKKGKWSSELNGIDRESVG